MQTSNKIKVVSYARVSTLKQADKDFSSIEVQESIIKEYVSRHPEYELVEMFSDKGRSAKNMNRPEIKRLISRIEQDDIRVVLSYRLDRVSREKLSFYTFEQLLREHKVKLIYTNDINFEDNPSGNLAKGVVIAASQYERETTALRIRDKYRAAVKAGYHAGGYPPLGYVCGKLPQTIDINEEEAPLVKEIFVLYLNGERPCDIAKTMYKKHGEIPPRISRKGKAYCASTYTENFIRRILANPLYCGLVYYTDDDGKIQYFEGKHSPIISRKDWDLVRQKLSQPKEKQESPVIRNRKPYLLKKILFCACGANMTVGGCGKKRKDGGSYSYYTCTRKKHQCSQCKCDTSIALEFIEDIVFSAIGYFATKGVSISDIKNANVDYKKSLEEEQYSLRIKISKDEDDLKNSLSKFESLEGNAILQEAIEKRLSEKSKSIEQMKVRLKEVNAELSGFKEKLDIGHLQVQASIENLPLCQMELSPQHKKEILEASVKKLVLKVKSRKGAKRLFSLTFFPKNEAEIAVVIEFSLDNSSGRGLWEISKPFNLKSYSLENKAPLASQKIKQHFLHKVVEWKRAMDEKSLSIRELSEQIGLKKSMVGRQLKMLSNLSESAIEYILRMRFARHTEQLGFRTLENISKKPAAMQVKLIKEAVGINRVSH